ncbi:DUF349 domain-containing protein [Maribellus comscasis]|uniref:DUF349 domain-containing protein n=1 Tax=Maribellus comscasis TaxID=2681766 RepID=A0A6I6K142_9BACT|nr:DUF349 domain-containing protein [Maribellus comscasis]QGY47158.1 DUF349 domain-containing protein [Maribellus comscasis]
MEPKDLKNSEELKNTEKADLENSEKNALPLEEEKDKKDLSSEEENVMSSDTTEFSNEEIQEEKTEEETDEKSELVPQDKKAEELTEEEISEEQEEQVAEKQSEPVAASPKEEKIAPQEEDNKTEEKKEEKEKAEETVTDEAAEDDKSPDKDKTESKAKPPVKSEEKIKEIKEEKPDYTKYSQVELVNAMRDALDNNGSHDVKDEIDIIKSTFYRNLKTDLEEQKKKFLEEGGNIEEFRAEGDPYEQDIKDLLKRYRQIRIEFNKKLEVEKEENLKLKYEVIEEIKALINNEESINKTFQEFRDLQRKWREIGLVPQSEMKNLWDTYHFHVENFYDYIKINKELRDLDLKKNLEAKIKLCERAEELLVEPSIIKAFNTLQKYHERWREIGPVPLEHKDDIWERFKAATSKINKKHQEFFESRKHEQKKNLEAKTALCEKVEEINQLEISSHKEWDEKSKELIELQKVWRTIGFAPRKDNNKIYERFRTECDKFFDAKREFYSKNKELQQNNLQMKLELCNEAESMKDSTDWKKTTQDFISIQKKWKEIGPVPRKHSDVVWKRFRAACDYFFDKKSEHFSGIDSEQVDNLKLKNELISEVEDFKPGKDIDENLKKLKSFQRRWTEIGHVPIKKKDDVQNRFRKAIDELFDELNLDEEKRNLLKFRSKMSSFSESGRGQSKMRMERDKYMNKLKQLENDLVLLDNNIGFFAKSKNAESLIEDVKKKIENTKQKIEFLKEKIRVIDDLDANE